MSDAAAPTRRREATRQRLLDAAAQVFAETGLAAASVEAVCERAGFTRGAFYSNFASKEELFLELSTRTAQQQIDAVRARVATLGSAPADDGASGVVQAVLEVAADDRSGVLLLNEMRLQALRTPALAEAFLAQEDALAAEVAQIVADIARAQRLRLRVAAPVAARLLLTTWTAASQRAVLAGLDAAGMRRALGEALAEAAGLVISAD